MQTTVFVSAIYSVYPTSRYRDILWERFSKMSQHLPVHIFCSAEDRGRADSMPGVTPHYLELTETRSWNFLAGFEALPNQRETCVYPERDSQKDTSRYMGLINAKPEFIEAASRSVEADHYVWVDAGVTKVLHDPDRSFVELRERSSVRLKKDRILIPGWNDPTTDLDLLTRDHTYWRFLGGMVAVPRDLVGVFARAAEQSYREIAGLTGKAVWEVSAWAYAESRMPIQWEKAMFRDVLDPIKLYAAE